jgi:hypothetical protein
LILSLLAAFLLGETAIRGLGHFDGDGDFFVGEARVYPCRWPIESLTEKIKESLSPQGLFFHCQYDPFLGWVPRPLSGSKNGLYFFNNAAIRKASKEIATTKSPPDGVLRIALFGDSFTHGDEVPFEKTWGYYLEEYLKQAGVNAEVLNFGVGAYGMDQIFLRWKAEGRAYKPHIVLFGLQIEDMHRNTNLVWTIYANGMGFEGPGIPFSKPRFILEDDELTLVNSPTPSPQRFLKIMRDMDTFKSWEFSKYEHWLDPKAYQTNFLFRSRLLAFIYSAFVDLFSEARQKAYVQESALLSLKIIREFKKDVEQEGGKFYAVYLPLKEEIKALSKGKKVPAADFLNEVETSMPLINPGPLLVGEMKKLGGGGRALNALFVSSHYNSRGNKIIAKAIADPIVRHEIK